MQRGVDVNDPVRAIADATLYEGYILWPYRRSAMKNQQRWTFGGVYPPAHTARHEDDPCVMQTQCLIEGETAAKLVVTVRFLQVVQRQVMQAVKDGFQPVDELSLDGERLVSWEEAVEREIPSSELSFPELEDAVSSHQIAIPAGRQHEELVDRAGERVGRIERSWEELTGRFEVSAQARRPGVWMLTVRIVNGTECEPDARSQALRHTMCSTHTLLRIHSGRFVSLTDPSEDLSDLVGRCVNHGTWPVLVGEPGERGTMLSSPIILQDYPRVAPESPGDLFDGGEIDQLLILSILSLTDAEKAEMRASDPRAREILERTEGLGPEELMRLHGAIREFGLAR
jgi:hypothetical protein